MSGRRGEEINSGDGDEHKYMLRQAREGFDAAKRKSAGSLARREDLAGQRRDTVQECREMVAEKRSAGAL